jgi:hypothetical protein
MAGPWEKYGARRGPINTGTNPSVDIASQNARRAQAEFDYRQQRDTQADAVEQQERDREAQMIADARQDAAEQLTATIRKIRRIKADVADSWTGVAGLGETGYMGWAQGSIPGTAAYSLRKDLGTIDAVQVLQAMTRLKELSPTGSTGFGALSGGELELLKSSVARLDPDMDQETFMSNLDEAERVYANALKRLRPAVQPKPKPKAGVPSDIQAIMRKYGTGR